MHLKPNEQQLDTILILSKQFKQY